MTPTTPFTDPLTCPMVELQRSMEWPQVNHDAKEVIGTSGLDVYLAFQGKTDETTQRRNCAYIARLHGKLGVVLMEGNVQAKQQIALDRMVRETIMRENATVLYGVVDKQGFPVPGSILCGKCRASFPGLVKRAASNAGRVVGRSFTLVCFPKQPDNMELKCTGCGFQYDTDQETA
jgi:hypothetical protein